MVGFIDRLYPRNLSTIKAVLITFTNEFKTKSKKKRF